MKKEIERAREWMEARGLSVEQLSAMSGYSQKALYWYLRGLTPPRTAKHIAGYQKSEPISAKVWKRFKLLCAGVDRELQNQGFDW